MRARRAPGGGAQVWPRVSTAQAGGGRPSRDAPDRSRERRGWSRGSLRGLGVPPRLARGVPASRFHRPPFVGVVLLVPRAECASLRRGVWKQE